MRDVDSILESAWSYLDTVRLVGNTLRGVCGWYVSLVGFTMLLLVGRVNLSTLANPHERWMTCPEMQEKLSSNPFFV